MNKATSIRLSLFSGLLSLAVGVSRAQELIFDAPSEIERADEEFFECLDRPIETTVIPDAASYQPLPLGPRLTLRADAVALAFDPESNVTIPSAIAGQLVSTSGFGQEFDAGLAARINYRLTRQHWLELAGVADVELNQSTELVESGQIVTFSQEGQFSYWEALYGYDFSSAVTIPFLPVRVSGLLGAGGMTLDQSVESFAVASVENHLNGILGGFRVDSTHGPWTTSRIDVLAGIFGNDSTLSNTAGSVGGDTLAVGGDQLDDTAFGGRLLIETQFSLNRHWFIDLGYRLHWMTDVALAGRNFEQNLNLAGTSIDASGNALLHGPSLGVTFVR